MANTSARMLRLLSLLQTHRYWPGAELAERLQVSPRTLRRDVDRLRELGYPVQAQRGIEGGYQLAVGAALPPLLVDDEEAVALAVGLQTAAQGAVEGIAESSVRALAKVVQVMPPRLRRRAEALSAMTVPGSWGGAAAANVDPGVLTSIALACRDSERIRFCYTSADGQRTTRHVEPHRLVSLGRRWYLAGYDLSRHDWRSFRLDRLAEPQATGARFRPRELPAADAAAFVRAGIGNARAAYHVEVVIDASAGHIRERIGRWATVEELDATRCRVLITADSLDWAVIALGAVGADFQVLSPPELLDQVRDWGRRFTRAAGAGSARLARGAAVPYDIGMRDTGNCEQCGALFTRRREHARFCSCSCRIAWNQDHASDLKAEANALDWSVAAMCDVTERLARVTAAEQSSAFVLISEAVWWVTIVDATLIRYHLDAYEGVMDAQPGTRRRMIEGTFGGLRFVRNQLGYYLDYPDFIEPQETGSRLGGCVTAWSWRPVPEPVMASLPPRGREWEMARYQAYQAHLAGRTIGVTFQRAAEFLKLVSAGAATALAAS